MYTVSKGPSKIVAKTRRGLTQNLERLDNRKESHRKSSDSDNGEILSMPKPVFHSNGKKTVHQRIQHNVITPQHEEMIRYISETWTQTSNADSEPSTPTSTIGSGSSSPAPSTLYYQDPPSAELENFTPFDLETWWGKRLFHNITNSI
ncbi:MAPK regulated corepressor interacting protein 2 [Danaus plexippus]|uniref:Uncharacterized protein n=1 Tax=Danaus plexippus plexippus TaxID=278856 RepID=A0A212EX80_DANPL|nr:MAPK regulated corepressor interacting protein 2 [Danaus plexippus]OWR46106.1 hypothetical protein KGM_213557 [Danaus plexippus plexippus]